MRDSYLSEVDEIISLLHEEVSRANEEARELEHRFLNGKERSKYPLGRKFLLNRGHGLSKIIDKLDTFLKDHY